MQFLCAVLLNVFLTLYDMGERISSLWPEFRFYNKKGSQKNPMSGMSMSR